MKKFLSLFLALVITVTIAGPAQTIDAASKYSINKTNLTLYIGAQYSLKIDGYSNFIMWKSDNSKVASVTSEGKVKAKKEGTAAITATIGSGSNNKKFTCTITVKNRIIPNKKSITCTLDEFQTLKVALKNPKSDESLAVMIKNPNLIDTKWGSSSKENILNIIPKKVGYTEITICTVEGSGFDEKLNTDTGITVGVTVLEDNSGWISQKALSSFDVTILKLESTINIVCGESSYSSKDYYIEDVPTDLDEGVVYNSNEISYKSVKGKFYFKVSDLRELKIMR